MTHARGRAAGLLAAFALAAGVAACGSTPEAATEPEPLPQPGQTLTYTCSGGTQFTAAFGAEDDPDLVQVSLTGRTLMLERIESHSGAQYEAEDATLWVKGEIALLKATGGVALTGCLAEAQGLSPSIMPTITPEVLQAPAPGS